MRSAEKPLFEAIRAMQPVLKSTYTLHLTNGWEKWQVHALRINRIIARDLLKDALLCAARLPGVTGEPAGDRELEIEYEQAVLDTYSDNPDMLYWLPELPAWSDEKRNADIRRCLLRSLENAVIRSDSTVQGCTDNYDDETRQSVASLMASAGWQDKPGSGSAPDANLSMNRPWVEMLQLEGNGDLEKLSSMLEKKGASVINHDFYGIVAFYTRALTAPDVAVEITNIIWDCGYVPRARRIRQLGMAENHPKWERLFPNHCPNRHFDSDYLDRAG
jgi:hypothetical protein